MRKMLALSCVKSSKAPGAMIVFPCPGWVGGWSVFLEEEWRSCGKREVLRRIGSPGEEMDLYSERDREILVTSTLYVTSFSCSEDLDFFH